MLSFNQTKQAIILGLFALVALIGVFVITTRKGKWVCKDNVWVAKGNPTDPKPGLYCK